MRALHLRSTAALVKSLAFVYYIFTYFIISQSRPSSLFSSICWWVVLSRVMETGQPRFRVVLRLTQRKALLDTLT